MPGIVENYDTGHEMGCARSIYTPAGSSKVGGGGQGDEWTMERMNGCDQSPNRTSRTFSLPFLVVLRVCEPT